MENKTTLELRPMTPEELENFEKMPVIFPYEDRVVQRIHMRYSLNDEIAMIWKDPSDPEVIEYRAFVENIKAEERAKENNIV